MQNKSKFKVMGRVVWYLCSFLFEICRILVILTAVVLVGLYLFGIRPYVVVTGSMQPTIMTGSICFVNQNIDFNEIQEQDIIAFRLGDNTTVTHRAIRIDGENIYTQGDANNVEDATAVTVNNFIGETIFWIPEIGKYVAVLRSKRGLLLIGALIVLMFLVDVVLQALKPKKEDVSEIQQETESETTEEHEIP